MQAHVPLACATGARGGLHSIDDGERVHGRVGEDADAAARLGEEDEAGGAEIDQQGRRASVVRAVGSAIEVAALLRSDIEEGVVDDEIAVDMRHAFGAQLPQELPQRLRHEERIATSLKNEVSAQPALGERAVEVDPCLPEVRRAEQLERGVGREQLDGRGRRARLIDAVCEQHSVGAGLRDQGAHRRGRDVVPGERAHERWRQVVVAARGRQRGQRQPRRQSVCGVASFSAAPAHRGSSR